MHKIKDEKNNKNFLEKRNRRQKAKDVSLII
jgi:hypothetical protein